MCCAAPPREPHKLSSSLKPLCSSFTSAGLLFLGRPTPQLPHQAPSLLSSSHQLHLMTGTDQVGGSTPTPSGKQDPTWKQMGPC